VSDNRGAFSRRASGRARWTVLLVALALSALAGAVAPASALSASATLFNFTGRGWGHGIGMSQYGVYGYATHTDLSYKAILQHYYTGISFGTVPNSTIRVMLNQGLSSARVTSTASFKVTDGTTTKTIAAGLTATVTWNAATSSYSVTWGSPVQTFTTKAPVIFQPGDAYLKLLNATQLGYAGVQFRGVLRVIHLSGGFMVVNQLPLESYLYGVVPREMPASWPLTALEAQAVAARSYAVATRNSGGLFDVYCTAYSQVYNGVGVGQVGEVASSNRAVDLTKGVVATYAGKVITAYFFSTSGGYTENIENVWPAAAPQPYLKGVPDPYDDASPYHIWTPFTLTDTQVAADLGTYSYPNNQSGVDGALCAITVVKRGVSPRVVLAYVVGSKGAHPISGSTLRVRLGLRDTWVYIRSLSIAPSQATHKTLTFGQAVPLTGRIYPGLATGATLTLNYYRDGTWHTMSVKTVRGSQALGNGYNATYSSYAVNARPPKTTEYYFSWGKATSPHTVLTVQPAITLSASEATVKPGDTVTFVGSVLPNFSGTTVSLQVKSSGTSNTWQTVAQTQLDAQSTYRVTWTLPTDAAGDQDVRLSVPATNGLAAGTSSTVVLSVSAQ